MADEFTKEWLDNESGGTPLDAEAMNDFEARAEARVALKAALVDDDGYLWKRHGVVSGAAAAAQDAAVDALITAIGTKGGETRPAPGITMLDSIEVPVNRAIRVRGYGPGWRSTGGRNTVLQRKTAVSDPLLFCSGIDATNSGRALLDVMELQIDGRRDAGLMGVGPLLVVNRGSECHVEDVRLYNNDGYGASFGQFYNGHIRELRVSHCGSPTLDAFGRTQPAVFFGGMPDGGAVTINCSDLQLEQNYCTDLRVGYKGDAQGFVTEFNLEGAKFEGGLNSSGVPAAIAFPYIDLDFCEIANFTDIIIFSHRSVPAIIVNHVAGFGEDDGVHFNGLNITQSPTTADPDYMIEVTRGSCHIRNATLRGKPNIAYIHVGANVHADAFSFDGNVVTRDGSAAPPLVKDDRAAIA